MPDSKAASAPRDMPRTAGVPPLLLSASPWAIRDKALLAEIVNASRGASFHWSEVATAAAGGGGEAPEPTAGVAVIPLTGIITPMGSWLAALFGGAPGGLVAFRKSFRAAVASPDVSAIVIDVDSPGGIVDLVPETAGEIREARGAKPIVAIADTQMCSAAYWIGAQADEVVITPSGYAGSVGAYRVHEDWSKFNESFGVAVSYIHAGEFKVEGNPDAPLSDEARERWQADIADVYDRFVSDVAEGRGATKQKVLDDYGQGRALNARRAVEAGVADRVATYEDVIAGLLGSPSVGTSGRRVENLSAAGDVTTPPVPPPHPVLTDDQRREAAALLLA